MPETTVSIKRQDNDKVPVLCILSNGRSGSTLLDLLLGAHPNLCTRGEAQLLPCELRGNYTPSACAAEFTNASSGSRYSHSSLLAYNNYPTENFRERPWRGKVLRWNRLLNPLRGRV